MSIESQRSELERAFGERSDISIVAVFEESKSAKAPGRPMFADMLSRIETGEAEGIIAWAPDRLARNSIDGGRIVYMLDCRVVCDLKFSTYTFENNPQGKFMLSIMFGQSKYYSDALSENVKRGNRAKIARGWRPNQAPLGYLNDPVTKTIVKDPERFPLIRRMFELLLSGSHSPIQIARLARDEWGLRTPKRKRMGGKPLAPCSIYRIFGNPFYAGVIRWGSGTYPGSHEPMITLDELAAARRQLVRPGKPKPQKHVFAYTGLIRCGACGLMVTAEHKTKRSGRHYIYYHCSRSRPLEPCHEPYIEVKKLEAQIAQFLRSLDVQPDIDAWLLDELAIETMSSQALEDAQRASTMRAIEHVAAELRELTGLRVRGLLTDPEFIAERQRLQQEEWRLKEHLATSRSGGNSFEPVRNLLLFSKHAADWFERGDSDAKRLIVKTASSNPTLKGKILSIEAAKPFETPRSFEGCGGLRGVNEDVRTRRDEFRLEIRSYLNDIRVLLQHEEWNELRRHLETLCAEFYQATPKQESGKRATALMITPTSPIRPRVPTPSESPTYAD